MLLKFGILVRMKKIIIAPLVLLTIILAGCTGNQAKPTSKPVVTIEPLPIATPEIRNMNRDTVTVETNKGTIVIEMYNEDAPKTVANFEKLAQQGFYNNLTFHRVIKDFMIQGGDPSGNGTGGPGYKFEDELNPNAESYKRGYKRGVVAMANAGPNTNGSQFFIMHKDYPLPNAYTIFGHVISGQEVVDEIARTETDMSDKPKEPVVMKTLSVDPATGKK